MSLSNSPTSARQNERRQSMSEILRTSNPFRGFRAIFYKEALHLRRDSMAIMFALAVPILEMIILGYAIDTNVRQVKTVVYDQTGIMERSADTQGSRQSRALLERFSNSDTFRIYKYVHSDKELTDEMVAGRAKVGVKIPYDFDRDLLRGASAQVMVLVDGSDSSVAGQTMNSHRPSASTSPYDVCCRWAPNRRSMSARRLCSIPTR